MTKNLMRRIKDTIRRRLKNLELEEGIKVSLRLKREKWKFISELVETLNDSTIYVVKGYSLMLDIVLPTYSGKVLMIPFYISYNTYSVPKPYFARHLEEYVKDKKAKLLIQASFSLNSAEKKYNEFLKQKGLKGNKHTKKIIFALDESEYSLVEYTI